MSGKRTGSGKRNSRRKGPGRGQTRRIDVGGEHTERVDIGRDRTEREDTGKDRTVRAEIREVDTGRAGVGATADDRLAEEPQENRRRRWPGVVFACALAVVLIGVWIGTRDARLYSAAGQAYRQGRYEDAQKIYTDLGDYKDAKEQILACRYGQAKQYYRQEAYQEAKKLFADLGDYKKAENWVRRCEEALSTDGQFFRALKRGLRIRWDLYDEYVKEDGGEYEDPYDFADYCNAELEEIVKFESGKFLDEENERDARTYIGYLKDAKKSLKYFESDYEKYEELWNDTYYKRVILLQKFYRNGDLDFTKKKYRRILEDLMVDAQMAKESTGIQEKVQRMVSAGTLKRGTDKWGDPMYTLTMKNTMERTFEEFEVEVDVLDSNGNYITIGWSDPVTDWRPGMKKKVMVWFEDENGDPVTDVDVTAGWYQLRYYPYYTTGTITEY